MSDAVIGDLIAQMPCSAVARLPFAQSSQPSGTTVPSCCLEAAGGPTGSDFCCCTCRRMKEGAGGGGGLAGGGAFYFRDAIPPWRGSRRSMVLDSPYGCLAASSSSFGDLRFGMRTGLFLELAIVTGQHRAREITRRPSAVGPLPHKAPNTLSISPWTPHGQKGPSARPIKLAAISRRALNFVAAMALLPY